MRSVPDLVLLRSFAAELKARRTALGISQEELAGRSGVNRTFVGKIETAKSQPSLTMLFRLGHGLNCEVPELLASVVQRSKIEQRTAKTHLQ